MSGGENKSFSEAVSVPYQSNREVTDPALKSLLGNVTSQLNSYFQNATNGNNDLAADATNTLRGIMSGTHNIQSVNPYLQKQIQSVYDTTENDYLRNLAAARSSVQGLGQGTSNLAVGDVYNDYVTNRDNQIANLYSSQWNSDMSNALNAALGGLSENPTAQMGNLAIALLNNFTREYGTTPGNKSGSSSWQVGI